MQLDLIPDSPSDSGERGEGARTFERTRLSNRFYSRLLIAERLGGGGGGREEGK